MEDPTRPTGVSDAQWVDEAALDKLREMGDDSFVVEMIDAMLAFVPRVMSEARAGLIAGNLEPVVRMGHSLKSSAQSFGAEPMRALAVEIERSARDGHAEALPPLLDRMDHVFGCVRAYLVKVKSDCRKPA